MPTVTALRAVAGGRRVAVDLDGRRWRTVPADVAGRVGLWPGQELDRPALRHLGRELRRVRALDVAVVALRHRDFSRSKLDERLSRAGVSRSGRVEAMATLERAGLLDDARRAAGRAGVLAARARGNEAIRWELEQEGIAAELVEIAISGLPPEATRAVEVIARRGRSVATARYLAQRGFGEDVVALAVAAPGGEDGPRSVA